MISSEGPYTSGIFGGHKPTTQPLLLSSLDGDAELVIAALDEIQEPVVLITVANQRITNRSGFSE